MTIDYDSPWKEALDAYFEPFLAVLFPEVHAQIDWTRGYKSLDKQFQQVVREAELGRRYVDKLIKVWARDGTEENIFWQDFDKLQEEKRRPYVSSGEGVYYCRGLRLGSESMLRARLGGEGLKVMPEIREIYKGEKSEAILKALETATSPDEVRQLWALPAP
jgi:hypothetical protein